MSNNWNDYGFFSGITEDYSHYKWYKGEDENPYLNDKERPLAHSLWEYERSFHFGYLDAKDSSKSLKESYDEWLKAFLTDHLPGKSPNPYGDNTDWEKVFDTGKRI